MTWSVAQNLAWPDCEKITIDYLTNLHHSGLVTNVRPSTDVLATFLPLILVRRAGGVRVGIVDQPRLMIHYYDATEQLAAQGLALVRDELRLMVGVVGGFRISKVDEFLGPTPVPDPETDTPRQIMTVEAFIRANAR